MTDGLVFMPPPITKHEEAQKLLGQLVDHRGEWARMPQHITKASVLRAAESLKITDLEVAERIRDGVKGVYARIRAEGK